MNTTRDFTDTVVELCKDSDYREAILKEALNAYLEGDFTTGDLLIRDYKLGYKEVNKALKGE